MYEIGLTDLAVERVYHTRFGAQEFTAVLRKGRHIIERNEVFIEPRSFGDQLALLKKDNSQTEIEMARLKSELKRETSRSEIEIARLKSELSKVLSSRSWALTRPLRKLSGYLGMGRP